MKQNNSKNDDGTVKNSQAKEEIDIIELLHVIWAGKFKIIVATLVFCVLSVIIALSKPTIYKSEALLAPVKSENSSGKLAALAGQFGGLASLAGVDLSNDAGSTEEALAILESREFLIQFVRENNVLVPLFALQPLPFSKSVAINPEIYDEKNNEWVREIKPPFTKEPTDWEIYKKFSELLNISIDQTTGLITISIEWYIPEQAQSWVTLMVKKINSHMKKRDVDEAKKSIQFIREKINEVSLVDIQAIFYGLIEQHGRTIMLAEVRDEYVFRTIDPAVVPLEKFKPKRALICAFGTLFGAMVGMLWALGGYFTSNRKF